jgi:hypothetical protein
MDMPGNARERARKRKPRGSTPLRAFVRAVR